jgi:hypothetical protein
MSVVPTSEGLISAGQMADEFWKRPFARLILELGLLRKRMQSSKELEQEMRLANERTAKLPIEFRRMDAPIWFERARQIGGIINSQTREDLQLTLDDIKAQIDAAQDWSEDDQRQLAAQLQERLGARLVELGVLRAGRV